MKSINLSEIMINKAKIRLESSQYSKQFIFGESHSSGNIIRGLFKSEKEIILETNPGKYVLCPINASSSITKPTLTEKKPLEINLIKISELEYDDAIFIPMKTGKPIDYMFSTEGGIYPATNYMIIGDPGIVKSTQTLDLLSQITNLDKKKKVLFISGEMNQIDMYGYVKRYPSFGKIPTLFLCDYIDENPMEVLEQTFKQGWDLVLIDSFIEVQESIQSSLAI